MVGITQLLLAGVLALALATSSTASSTKELPPHTLERYLSSFETLTLNSRTMQRKHEQVRRSAEYDERPQLTFSFDSHGRTFNVVAEPNDRAIFSPDFKMYVQSEDSVEIVPLDKKMFYRGYVQGEAKSNVLMYVADGQVEATLYLADETYYVEKASKHFDKQSIDFSHIVYRRSDLSYDFNSNQVYEGLAFEKLEAEKRKLYSQLATEAELRGIPLDDNVRSRRAFDKATNNTCEMALIADDKYFNGPHGEGSLSTTAASMINHITQSSLIYITTDFTNVGLGIQHAIKQVTIYKSSSDSNNPYGTFTGDSANNFLNVVSEGDPLHSNSWDHVCLAHTFTHRTFANGILGLAWVGDNGYVANKGSSGICGRTAAGKSLNTGISTSQNAGSTLPTIVSIITFAHEVGHNHGSTHDAASSTASSSGAACAPGGVNGNYIMYAYANDGTLPNNDQFSDCSKDIMGSLIIAKAARCFTDVGSDPICGNGIFEGFPEECDCGINVASASAAEIAACAAKDPCCDPFDCKLKTTAQCSPMSGSCCSSTCTFIGVSLVGSDIGAVPADKTGSLASGGYKCRSATDCTFDTFCVADPLFRGECPPVDWVNDPANITLDIALSPLYPSCADNNHTGACYEFHKSSHSICNSGSSICAYDGCTRSICSQYVGTDVSGLIPNDTFIDDFINSGQLVKSCLLSSAQLQGNDGLQCVVACEFQEGVCAATSAYASTAHGLNQSVSRVYRAPGRTCNNFQGYCTSGGVCQDASADNPFGALANTSWITDNWPILVGVFGGFIVILIVMRVLYRGQAQQVSNVFRRLGTKIEHTMRRAINKNKGKAVITPTKPNAVREDNLKRLRNIKATEGQRRLRNFFPTVKNDNIIREVIATCGTEEEAVVKLLRMGYPIAAAPL